MGTAPVRVKGPRKRHIPLSYIAFTQYRTGYAEISARAVTHGAGGHAAEVCCVA